MQPLDKIQASRVQNSQSQNAKKHLLSFSVNLAPWRFFCVCVILGVTWVIRISVISACISVFFCAIESYVEPLSYDTKNMWWAALLRNPFLECCQFAPSITRSILIVSLWFSMRWKALSVLFRMICDTSCLVLLSEIALVYLDSAETSPAHLLSSLYSGL